MYPKRSESRALARTIRSLAVIGLFAVCLQDLRASPPSSGQVTVVIGVQPFVELYPMPPGGITMTEVTPMFFNGLQWTSTGALGIEVRTNCKATLRCASTVTLTCPANGRSYTVDAGLQWLGVSGAYPALGQGAVQYTCLDVQPGVYLATGAPFLTATIKKVWTSDDAPGTYTGSVLVEIMAN